MSKKRKDWRLYLLDMLECIKRIENYVEGLSYEQFLMDDKAKDLKIHHFITPKTFSKNSRAF